ncbi:related to cell surface ferroxidase [Melanopsichium pennsylvanicum]|uniref:Related to cell surface ferroxidase n=2 Tax=Melanopsichium pennsylvanicum TaxID=63383 RepID=A0AAJ4XSY9_9BASI|nr:related to cell surface ferroxidase [Melanopsichium pennsylvanicum 4]SNX87336.1 related to cell surface ferroxidase [Melanopsichium pennsylvanicum]
MSDSVQPHTPSEKEGSQNSKHFLDERGLPVSNFDHSSSQSRRRRSILLLASLAALLSVLALALGLGLGLGLKHSHRGQSDATTSAVKTVPGATASNLAFIPREDLIDPSQLTLNPTWDRYEPPQDRVYNWTLTQVLSNPAGTTKQMRLVNGMFPGPMVEANIGDRVIVNVENKMPVPTTIHWHGQFQRGSNEMDGSAGITECGIAPGTTFTYNWTVQQSGSYWWHSHYGPTYADGLFGPLILHGDDEKFRMVNPNNATFANTTTFAATTNGTLVRTDYDRDLIFVVNDAYQADSFSVAAIAKSKAGPPGGDQGSEPTPDYAMINGLGFSNCALAPNGTACVSDQPDGKSSYNFTVPANKRIRMRVINAGSLATFRFSVDGHNMTVIEADGTEVEPLVVQSLNVMVAQRYSVIIETDRSVGAYAVRAEVLDDMFAYDNPFLVMDQYAIMRYEGVSAYAQPIASPPNATLVNAAQSLSTSQLVPITRMDAPASNMTTTLVVNFGLDAYSNWHAFFNQTTFTSEMAPQASLMKAYTFENTTKYASSSNSSVGAYYNDPDEMMVTNSEMVVMDVIINNLDEGEHPFHLHGFTPFLIGSGAGNYQAQDNSNFSAARTNPMRRDVFSVPPFSWIAFRFIADNAGVWPFHCHLMPHMAVGLLMQFQVLPDQIASLPVSNQFYSQCSSVYDWVQQNQNLLTATGDPADM